MFDFGRGKPTGTSLTLLKAIFDIDQQLDREKLLFCLTTSSLLLIFVRELGRKKISTPLRSKHIKDFTNSYMRNGGAFLVT